jgi:hypothetical protein
MKKILVLCISLYTIFTLSSCSRIEQPEYDVTNFETYVFDEIIVDNVKTIADYKAESIVAGYWVANEGSNIEKRLFILSRTYLNFLIYACDLIYNNWDTIYSHFNDLENIKTISISYNENILYLGPSSISNDDKSNMLAISLTETFLNYKAEDGYRYIQEFSGINLADIFLPFLKSDKETYQSLATALNSMDNINDEDNFVYINLLSPGEEINFLSTGGKDTTIASQGDIGIYIDEDGVVKVSDENYAILLAITYYIDTQ